MGHINDMQIDKINSILKKITKNITLPVAIRLIHGTLKEWYPEKNSDELYEMLLFRTPPSLAFQKSDIYDIYFEKHDDSIRVNITLGFLSIFGASSPLPTHYNERILENSYETKVLVDFLEMLNHRLKKLIYPIWEKQRYYVSYQKDLKDAFSKYILSILGLYDQHRNRSTTINLHKLLPFSGILSMHQKSTTSLLAILRHYFEHEEIYIEEGVLTKSYFPRSQYFCLGEANSSLGEDTCIGTFVLTRHLKYCIYFNNIKWEDLIGFVLEKKKRKELKELIQLIQKTPLSYEVTFTLPANEIRPCLLGEEPLYLGVNAWLGEVNTPQSITI